VVERLPFSPGLFYKRVFRPLWVKDESGLPNTSPSASMDYFHQATVPNYLPNDELSVISGLTQLSSLIEQLKSICRTIEPNHKNFGSFGHELRNLLILACTEVEAQLRGIYDANSTVDDPYLNMSKYSTLNQYLKLDEYSILFSLYPWLDNFRPFSNWLLTGKKQILPWYDAYNHVKHNREKQFHKANLENVLNSIAALAILMHAQYGKDIPFWNNLIGPFFKFGQTPNWSLNEYYFPPFGGHEWVASKLFN
jgi:hypothetical protein